jgi:hypothetical protein
MIPLWCSLSACLQRELAQRMCCKPEDGREQNPESDPLHGGLQSEEIFHESNLLNNASRRQPPHLTFSNHVHRFDSLDRLPGTIHTRALKDRNP